LFLCVIGRGPDIIRTQEVKTRDAAEVHAGLAKRLRLTLESSCCRWADGVLNGIRFWPAGTLAYLEQIE
jgi:hypothetical protein